MKRILIILFTFFIIACSSNQKTENNQSVQAMSVPPAIPAELLIEIFESCDYIDFIFSNLPFSISQSDKSSIQQTIRHIEPRKPEKISADCPYMAEQIFQSEGNIILDAKIYFEEDCMYYLFYENGKAIYSASFTDTGIGFYNNIIQQAKATNANR